MLIQLFLHLSEKKKKQYWLRLDLVMRIMEHILIVRALVFLGVEL